jgi:hypothetical protein
MLAEAGDGSGGSTRAGNTGEKELLRNPDGTMEFSGAGSRVKIIDGKVGGKIPIEEYNALRKASIKNPDATSMTFGKYTNGADSYIEKAGEDSSYFDMGSDFNAIKQKYGLLNNEMFEYFNKTALDDAMSSGKTIQFSHNPIADDGFLGMEWEYIKSSQGLTDANLILEGGFWRVR